MIAKFCYSILKITRAFFRRTHISSSQVIHLRFSLSRESAHKGIILSNNGLNRRRFLKLINWRHLNVGLFHNNFTVNWYANDSLQCLDFAHLNFGCWFALREQLVSHFDWCMQINVCIRAFFLFAFACYICIRLVLRGSCFPIWMRLRYSELHWIAKVEVVTLHWSVLDCVLFTSQPAHAVCLYYVYICICKAWRKYFQKFAGSVANSQWEFSWWNVSMRKHFPPYLFENRCFA